MTEKNLSEVELALEPTSAIRTGSELYFMSLLRKEYTARLAAEAQVENWICETCENVTHGPPRGTPCVTSCIKCGGVSWTTHSYRAIKEIREAMKKWRSQENFQAMQAEIATLTAENERLQAELADCAPLYDLHSEINRRSAEVLGKPTSGDGSSWHDIPEAITAFRGAAVEKERAAFKGAISEIRAGMVIFEKSPEANAHNAACERAIRIVQHYVEGGGLMRIRLEANS